MSQEESKTKPMQIFWEVKEVYYGVVQVENRRKAAFSNFSGLAGPRLVLSP